MLNAEIQITNLLERQTELDMADGALLSTTLANDVESKVNKPKDVSGGTHTPIHNGNDQRGYNSLTDAKDLGSVLSAHNINYEVNVSKGCCKGTEEKKILHDVTGVFHPGMNAIMGQTGSGKSTFLDVLADRKGKEGVSGTLLLDGKPVPNNFKCMVGYVVQDDVVVGTLTVKENLSFSAALRLPQTVKQSERNQRVDNVITELGLTKCENTKVGTAFIRGVSGGERRRCNIGMELIISPSVLFLDEPTTGLDANTANSVLHFLWRLSRRGRCIIFSIHQPRYTIYQMFDTIMLLSDGHTIYHGPAKETLDFFGQQGYRIQPHNNPPDFFLDVINGDPMVMNKLDDHKSLENVLSMERKENVSQHDKLVKAFKSSPWYTKLQAEANSILDKFNAEGGHVGHKRHNIAYATSFGHQIAVVGARQFRNLVRNPQTSVMTAGASFFFSFIASVIFWQLDKNPDQGFLDRSGAIFFLLMNQMFFNFSAIEIFISERKIFMHENISGFYRVSVYFLVKIFCDVMPLRLLPVTIISCITYFTIGFQEGVNNFFLFVLALYCVTLCAASLVFLISSLAKVFAVAQMLLSLCFVIMMLFAGFIINLGSISEWINWLKYLSIIKYAFAILCINEFKDQNFCEEKNDTLQCVSGNTFLELRNIDYKDDWDFWHNYVALISLSLIYFTLTYIVLLRMKKHV